VAASDAPVIAFADPAELRAWLEEHHADSPDGVWIELTKKRAGVTPGLDHAGALEVALCFGWIDGQARSVDDATWLRRFTPRRARSTWSKINCAKAEALISAGLMHPAGLAEVERAKADGRWAAAYDAQSQAAVPEDLAAALAADPAAQQAFDGLDSRNRYSILHRLQTAKRPETRARRLATYVTMLAEGRRIHP
jgi:uncharacterized protein YdeI (YjbR/CyaY-like superfamily)